MRPSKYHHAEPLPILEWYAGPGMPVGGVYSAGPGMPVGGVYYAGPGIVGIILKSIHADMSYREKQK